MDQSKAIEAFAATRMYIYRQLARQPSNSLRVGEISNRLRSVPPTLSGHLAILKRAGLLRATRHRREIHYSADMVAINDLISFLPQDCCDGQMAHCRENLALLKTLS